MTDEQLNALVAEKVFGYMPSVDDRLDGKWWTLDGIEHVPEEDLPNYCTDISAAWQVVEKMADRMWRIVLLPESKIWQVGFIDDIGWSEDQEHGTLPRAICLAALKACGVEV